MGVEPIASVWKTADLPLIDTRGGVSLSRLELLTSHLSNVCYTNLAIGFRKKKFNWFYKKRKSQNKL